MNTYYVYVYLNTLKPGLYEYQFSNQVISFDYEPFYVGKGSGTRYLDHVRRNDRSNKLKKGIIDKIVRSTGAYPVILFIKSEIEENEAFKLEYEVVKSIGRRDLKTGPLANLTDGGRGGMPGYKVSDETRATFSRVKKEAAKFGKDNHTSKPIHQYNLDGSFVKSWDCIEDCNRQHGFQSSHIISCTKGRAKTAFGFQWFREHQGDFVPPITRGKVKSEGYLPVKDPRNGRKRT